MADAWPSGPTHTESFADSFTDCDRPVTVAEIDAQFDRVLSRLGTLSTEEQIAALGRYGRAAEARRLVLAARRSHGNRRRAKAALGDPDRSQHSMNRDARRAITMARNELLADEVGSGGIAPETIDHLTRVCDEEGCLPDDLITKVSGAGPDEARRIIAHYIETNAETDEVDKAYERQMKARRIRRYDTTTLDGIRLAGLSVEGPDAIIDRIYNQINAQADSAYQAAGGRDKPVGDHTAWPHRQFDAAISFFGVGHSGAGQSGAGGADTSSTPAPTPARSRPAVVVSIPIDADGPKVATQSGTGPISADLFAQYAPDGDVSVVLTDLEGIPLWLGRSRRRASIAQYVALVVRDRGCVLCGAHVLRCDAHHLMPWEAPGKGQTDLDNLALLCRACHSDLHLCQHTLVPTPGRRADGSSGTGTTWSTRPATIHERPPPRPVQTE